MNLVDTNFTQELRAAQGAIIRALDTVEDCPDDAIEYPGKGYLMARLETALDIIELELPEFRKAAMAEGARRLLDALVSDGTIGVDPDAPQE